jgi:hypothetical protein
VTHESLDSMQALSPLLICYRGIRPTIADDAWIAPNATVTGDTETGAQSSIWFGCIVCGDVSPIRIGARVNIQDGAIIHVSSKGIGTLIGDEVSIGAHGAHSRLHAADRQLRRDGSRHNGRRPCRDWGHDRSRRARNARQGGSNRSNANAAGVALAAVGG